MSNLVKIARRGVILEVHEDALEQHFNNGWQEVVQVEEPAAEQPEQTDTTRGGRKQKTPAAEQPE